MMKISLAEKRNLSSNSVHPHRIKNYESIFETIRNSDTPLSISEICRITGISHPTVARILEELHEKKLIKYEKNHNTYIGRKPITVQFCADAGVIMGLEIGNETYGVITDLKGKIISRKNSSLSKHKLDAKNLIEFVEHISDEDCFDNKKLLGIGVAMSGMVNMEGEYINLEKKEKLPVKKILEDKFSVPVIVENDANMMMLAENQMGIAKDIQNGIYVLKTSSGIGFGIMVNGGLYRGSRGLAGENLEVIPSKVNGEIKETEKFIKGICKLIYLFDPDIVILGGELINLGTQFLDNLRKKIDELDEIKRNVKIEFAKLGRESIVLAVTNLGIQKLFNRT